MTFEIAIIRNVSLLRISHCRIPLFVFVFTSLLALQARAEFSLNFSSGSNVVSSWANQSCGGDGGMMDGMGGMGGGCDTPFRQELISDNGTEYYHVIIGDESSDFALEFYMRTGGCCWWDGGMGGMMGGGSAPYSSSYGDTSDRFANAREPLADWTVSGNGTGNPSRVYMRQITRDSQMDQEYIKAREAMKPRIVQNITDGSTQLGFDLDMSNGDYNSFSAANQYNNTMTLGRSDGIGDFNAAIDAPQANLTAGQFSYSEGSGHGGSAGSYSYAADEYDVYGVDWESYCDPNQNSHDCSFGGGMMGGMMGM